MTKRWGPITWFLLHMFAEKIIDEKFQIYKNKCLEVIYNFCCHLPCPSCSQHAKAYLNKYGFLHRIQTKKQLRKFLWSFHNEVNKRLKKQEGNIILLKMYHEGDFQKILNLFTREILKPVGSANLTELMYKDKYADELLSFINNNKHLFYK